VNTIPSGEHPILFVNSSGRCHFIIACPGAASRAYSRDRDGVRFRIVYTLGCSRSWAHAHLIRCLSRSTGGPIVEEWRRHCCADSGCTVGRRSTTSRARCTGRAAGAARRTIPGVA
jgi:hypothetical protein